MSIKDTLLLGTKYASELVSLKQMFYSMLKTIRNNLPFTDLNVPSVKKTTVNITITQVFFLKNSLRTFYC